MPARRFLGISFINTHNVDERVSFAMDASSAPADMTGVCVMDRLPENPALRRLAARLRRTHLDARNQCLLDFRFAAAPSQSMLDACLNWRRNSDVSASGGCISLYAVEGLRGTTSGRNAYTARKGVCPCVCVLARDVRVARSCLLRPDGPDGQGGWILSGPLSGRTYPHPDGS